MKDFAVKADGVGDKLTAAEFNNYIDEAENLVKNSGQTLNESDTNQTGKGVANYVGAGDFFVDSGAADAYVLSAGALRQAPTALVDGLRVRFIPTHTNTGASTVNLNGLGATAIKTIENGVLIAGDIVVNVPLTLIYSSSLSAFYIQKNTILIQNYTAVGNIGDVGQKCAGRDYSLSELEAFFSAAKVISFNKFAAGAALPTDEKNTYNYTLGAAAKTPSNGVGIMGLANTAISFDGGNYATHATKFDDFNTVFSGVGKGLIHSFWVLAPTDGRPTATNCIFYKKNTAANDSYGIALLNSGQIYVTTRGNSATPKTILSLKALPNGSNSIWVHIVVSWNTTNGLQIWVNGKLEDQNASATTLMTNGTTADFMFGGTDTTPSDPFTGRIVNEIIINDVCLQPMVDFLYATSIDIPSYLQANNFIIEGKYRYLGSVDNEKPFSPKIVQKRSTDILFKGNTTRFTSTDTIKLTARL